MYECLCNIKFYLKNKIENMLLLIVIFLGCTSILTVYRFLSVNIFLFDLKQNF